MQSSEILDDPIVHDRDDIVGLEMRTDIARTSVAGPACATDADGAAERLTRKAVHQLLELALRAAERETSALERRQSGRVAAAIFKTPEGRDDLIRNRLAAENSDDATQEATSTCHRRSNAREHRSSMRPASVHHTEICARGKW